MKYLILIISLLFMANSYAYTCPKSSNLKDPSTLDRCFYKIVSHYNEHLRREIVKSWQRNSRYGEDLDSAGYSFQGYIKYNLRTFNILYNMQSIIDRHESKGVYKTCPSSN